MKKGGGGELQMSLDHGLQLLLTFRIGNSGNENHYARSGLERVSNFSHTHCKNNRTNGRLRIGNAIRQRGRIYSRFSIVIQKQLY